MQAGHSVICGALALASLQEASKSKERIYARCGLDLPLGTSQSRVTLTVSRSKGASPARLATVSRSKTATTSNHAHDVVVQEPAAGWDVWRSESAADLSAASRAGRAAGLSYRSHLIDSYIHQQQKRHATRSITGNPGHGPRPGRITSGSTAIIHSPHFVR